MQQGVRAAGLAPAAKQAPAKPRLTMAPPRSHVAPLQGKWPLALTILVALPLGLAMWVGLYYLLRVLF